MTVVRAPRWALSFADLCLLLLGFFVILHAQRDPAVMSRTMRAAFGDAPAAGATPMRADRAAAAIFLPGEAVLTPAAARWLAGLGARAARGGGGIAIVSEGADGGTARLDGWELAAARAAAAGRAVRAGGLDERRVMLAMPAAAAPGGQMLRITLTTPTPDR